MKVNDLFDLRVNVVREASVWIKSRSTIGAIFSVGSQTMFANARNRSVDADADADVSTLITFRRREMNNRSSL